ncbi:serine/threonine-protein kinase fused [Phymastichus coffea]|uniref:serine/threonine-protein kinase fused n=1 Tax=Phymastichus coffea TaxID=108790 RepID=UPI00273AF426|nr:serine/threonine-protein kinase fused [Phymastichus coffea]
MENYEMLKQVGEGSFGQVFKARRRGDNAIVAFKVTRKKGRTDKELVSLRRECEVQKELNHPNIIRMFDSFETDSKFIVITEYVEKELYDIVVKAGRLSEERSQVIACDLVSALHYLHTRRILHRDLKPQNVLVDTSGVAKLCDFGFARLMSQEIHVLRSVKGTPLYMAPELIDELPYDHKVDLWSLGCIVYELVSGVPPFQTTSMRYLVSMVRQADIKWPEHISDNCRSFLQGLLQKDPTKRLAWPELKVHPFVKDRLLMVDEENIPRALTSPLSASQARAKQQQLQSLASRFTYTSKKILERQIKKLQSQMMRRSGHTTESESGSASVDVLLNNLSLRASLRSDMVAADFATCRVDCPIAEEEAAAAAVAHNDTAKRDCAVGVEEAEDVAQDAATGNSSRNATSATAPKATDQPRRKDSAGLESEKKPCEGGGRLADWSPTDNEQPIENEEWLVFLQQSMEEVMVGEVDSLLQDNCVSVFVGPLKNPAANCRVVDFVACLLSLPYAVKSLQSDKLEKIQRVYLDAKVVPNLVYAAKLLIRDSEGNWKSHSALLADELQALERAMTLLSRLVHLKHEFLEQFYDALYLVPDGTLLFQYILGLDKRKSKIVASLIAILNQILRSKSGFVDAAEDIVFKNKPTDATIALFADFMTHQQSIVRSRSCTLLLQLALNCSKTLQQIWGRSLRELLEGLTGDADKSVHDAAVEAIKSLQKLPFYAQERHSSSAAVS